MNNDELMHYGTPRHSGRYPWGSGDNPYQHDDSFLKQYREAHAAGISDTEFAKARGMSTTEFRARRSIDTNAERAYYIAQTRKLVAKGYSNVKIAEMLHTSESNVRNWKQEDAKARVNRSMATAEMLKKQIDEKGCIDIGVGVERELNISKEQLKVAAQILKEQGYVVDNLYIDQVTNPGNKTTVQYIAKPGTEKTELYSDLSKVHTISAYSPDGGDTFQVTERPSALNHNRVMVRYDEDGGTTKDGTIEIRRGLEDVNLGKASYAQVRIAMDNGLYMKGMAVYSDKMPNGVDIIFNSNKKRGTSDEKVFKALKEDPDNPFGALIKPNSQMYYADKNGDYIKKGSIFVKPDANEKLSADTKRYSLSPVNKLKEEGDWDTYSKTLSSQFLSKQNLSLINRQLKLTYDQNKLEYDEIMRLTNPAVKKKLLMAYAEQCDSSAVDLKAAALPRQSTKVILPIDSLKANEVYAPTYKNGERLVLIRYPHAGTFEIPELIVNNKNALGNSIIGKKAIDAIGINSKVAERLSGADFDGDTVMCIPVNSRVRIQTSAPLKALEGFDPKAAYPGYPGMKVMTSQRKGMEMGSISNLITDMTLRGATPEELARAVKHSMVVIDAEKHKLNYKQSEIDNNIPELKKKYQGGAKAGASTLVSRASGQKHVPEYKLSHTPDPVTGEWIKTPTDRTYTKYDKKTGTSKEVLATTVTTQMAWTNDARTLSSGHIKEEAYAKYANNMKALANRARREAMAIETIPKSPSAAKTYAHEVSSLVAKLNTALQNAPKERHAQLIANQIVKAKLKNDPDMDKEHQKRLAQQELAKARIQMGANKKNVMVSITDKEWEAIQAGAISTNKLSQILDNADLDVVRQLATPRSATSISPAKQAKIQMMSESGNYTLAEIAASVGVSTSTVQKYSE